MYGCFWGKRQTHTGRDKLRCSLLATKTGARAEQARVCQCLSWEIWTCLTPSTAWAKSHVKDKHSVSYERLHLNKSFYHNIKRIVYLNSRKYYKWVQTANLKSWPLWSVRDGAKPGFFKAVVIFESKNDCVWWIEANCKTGVWTLLTVFSVPPEGNQPADQNQKSFLLCAPVIFLIEINVLFIIIFYTAFSFNYNNCAFNFHALITSVDIKYKKMPFLLFLQQVADRAFNSLLTIPTKPKIFQRFLFKKISHYMSTSFFWDQ